MAEVRARMRTRRSREQWAAILEELAASGESAEGFCRRRGIRRETLSWWKWNLARTSRSSPSRGIRLLPVAVSSEAPAPRSRGILIELADVSVHVEVGTDVAYVAALVESLRRRC